MQTAKELEQFTTCNISSFELMTKWLDVGYTLGLSSNALQLMTVLLRFYNPLKKYVFPHQDTLATRTNTSVASVKRGLNELLKANLIVKTRTRNGNLYAFTGKLFELLESSICTKETAQNEPCMNHEPIKRTNKTSTNKQKNVVAFTKNFQNKREIISLEDVPEIIQKKAKTNPCGYWASIPESERKRIWQEQKKLDEKRAKTQAKLELKRKMEAQEQLKIEKEYSEHPKFEDYTRLQALAFCSKFVTFGKGKALKFQQVKEFTTKHNITWTEIVEYKEKTKLEKCCNFQNDMI